MVVLILLIQCLYGGFPVARSWLDLRLLYLIMRQKLVVV